MTEKRKSPALRFRGYTDDWEQRKLSELTSMHARIGWQNLRTSEFLDSGNYMLITGTDFNDGAINFSTCHYVERERYEQDRNIQIHNGSILITKDGTLGKVAYVQGLSMPATLNAGVFNVQIKDANNVDEKYLFQYLKAPFLMDYVDKKATGGTIKHLNQSILVDFPVILPQRSEQTLIGAFFQQLDNLITLHQRKLEKLKLVKKSMLEKMFPKNGSRVPEIRFKGFTDDWEQRKLGITNTFFTDGNYGEAYPKASDMTDSGSGIPFLTGGNLKEGKISLDGVSYITPEKHSQLTSGHLLEDDIVIAVRGSLGALGYVNTDNSGWNINSQLAILRTDKSELYGKFLIQYLLSWAGQNELLKRQTGSALKQLPIGALKDFEVPITSVVEQKKIGAYFQSLDNLITLHQRKVEKLQIMKKSMLEKMFV